MQLSHLKLTPVLNLFDKTKKTVLAFTPSKCFMISSSRKTNKGLNILGLNSSLNQSSRRNPANSMISLHPTMCNSRRCSALMNTIPSPSRKPSSTPSNTLIVPTSHFPQIHQIHANHESNFPSSSNISKQSLVPNTVLAIPPSKLPVSNLISSSSLPSFHLIKRCDSQTQSMPIFKFETSNTSSKLHVNSRPSSLSNMPIIFDSLNHFGDTAL